MAIYDTLRTIESTQPDVGGSQMFHELMGIAPPTPSSEPESLTDERSMERESAYGRFVVSDENIPLLTQPIDFRQIRTQSLFALPENMDQLSNSERAALVIAYLGYLRSIAAHNFVQPLRPSHQLDLQQLIELSIEHLQPLTFPINLSLEKFANPIATKDSHIDISEAMVVEEMKAFIIIIERITGIRPKIVIFNESPINNRFSNGSWEVYTHEFSALLHEAGIAQDVTIVASGRDFLLNILRERLAPLEAEQTLDDLLNLFMTIYALIQFRYNKTPNNKNQYISDAHWLRYLLFNSSYPEETREYLQQEERSAGVPRDFLRLYGKRAQDGPFLDRFRISMTDKDLLERIYNYLVTHISEIREEIRRSVRTDFHGCIDPSLLFEHCNVDELALALQRDFASTSPPVRSMRSRMLYQAEEQGPFFKMFMRLRNMFEDIYHASPFGEYAIPISCVTNFQADKHTIPLARYPNGIKLQIDGTPVPVTIPQHGVGVIVEGTVISVPYEYVFRNQALFRRVIVQYGSILLPGYIYIGN